MPRRKKEVKTVVPESKPWVWIAPELRDDNYDGVIMESEEVLAEAKKNSRKNDRELKKWLERKKK